MMNGTASEVWTDGNDRSVDTKRNSAVSNGSTAPQMKGGKVAMANGSVVRTGIWDGSTLLQRS